MMHLPPKFRSYEEEQKRQEQLRRDFDYPSDAHNLEVVQVSQDFGHGRYFMITLKWEVLKREMFYNAATHTYQWQETVERFSRDLEPRTAAYLV